MNAFHSRGRAFPVLSTMLSVMLLVLSAHASPPGWSDQVRLSEGTLDDSNHAVVTSDDHDRVHVLWDDYRNLDLELYYRQWTGSVWTPELPLTGG